MIYVDCEEEVGITFSLFQWKGGVMCTPHTSKVANWHGLECIKGKNVDSDKA